MLLLKLFFFQIKNAYIIFRHQKRPSKWIVVYVAICLRKADCQLLIQWTLSLGQTLCSSTICPSIRGVKPTDKVMKNEFENLKLTFIWHL